MLLYILRSNIKNLNKHRFQIWETVPASALDKISEMCALVLYEDLIKGSKKMLIFWDICILKRKIPTKCYYQKFLD